MTDTEPTTARGFPSHISVLVLDDQRFDRHKLGRLCATLPTHAEILNADSLAALNALLDATTFDLIFVDYNLPDGSGLDALERIRMSPRNCNAASIMITGADGEEIALDAMSRGCADFITKHELSPTTFTRAVTNALQKSALSTQVAAQTFAREEVERVLKSFASQCANDIKPMLSRMMRQLRDLRDTPAQDHRTVTARRESVEASCMHLWEFLDDLERHHPDVMMKDLAASAPLPAPAKQPGRIEPTAATLGLTAPAPKPRPDRPVPFAPEAVSATPPRPKRPPSPFSRPL